MRRTAAAIAFGLGLAACSTPQISLTPRFGAADARTYRLEVRARTTLDLGTGPAVEEAHLVGRTRVAVQSIRGDEATLALTLTVERLSRAGRVQPTPAEQRATLVLGPDGGVRTIETVGGLPADLAGGDVADLAPLLGAPMPAGRIRLGQRWSMPLPTVGEDRQAGQLTGRLAGVRVVRAYDCAIARLGIRRPLILRRTFEGRTVTAAGTEHASSEIAFAFRQGFPVEIRTHSEARLDVSSGAFRTGTLVIQTDSTLALEDA